MKQHARTAAAVIASPPLSDGASARDRILHTAYRLFYSKGLRATGVDLIIAESGVAKMSFYRNFPSKSDLIAAFLEQRHDDWMRWFTEAMDEKLRDGHGLEAIADVLANWFEDEGFRGCAFINAVAESGNTDSAEHAAAVAHKKSLQDYLKRCAQRLGLSAPSEVADEAMLVVEGMIVRFQTTGDARVARSGKRLLQNLAAEHAQNTKRR